MYYIRSRSVEFSDDPNLQFSDLVLAVENMPEWYTPDKILGLEVVNGELTYNDEKRTWAEDAIRLAALPRLNGLMFVDFLRSLFINESLQTRIAVNKLASATLDVIGRTNKITYQDISDISNILQSDLTMITAEQFAYYNSKMWDWLAEHNGTDFLVE